MDILSLTIGIVSGGITTYLILGQTLSQSNAKAGILENELHYQRITEQNLKKELQAKQNELQNALTTTASIEAQLKTLKEQHQNWVQSLQTQWNQQFEAFMLKQVDTAKTSFKESAKIELLEKQSVFEERMKEMLKPITLTIESYKKDVQEIDEQHIRSTQTILNEMRRLGEINTRLSHSLSHNKGRGNWGEIELERLLEDSGLIEGVGYIKQPSFNGGKKRPDICIKLPDNRSIFIDSKALQVDFNESIEDESPEGIQERQKQFAKSLEMAIKNLSSKEYQAELETSADFVVLYVPRESMLANAMTVNPNLFELAYRNNIILAGPYNVMGLLKLVYHGWRMAKLSEQAGNILKLGTELQQQGVIFADKLDKVGKNIDQLARNYHEALTSFDGKSGLTKKIKRLEEYGCHSGKLMPEQLYIPDSGNLLSSTTMA